jgi:hypothetical protein
LWFQPENNQPGIQSQAKFSLASLAATQYFACKLNQLIVLSGAARNLK